jgi:hypothetical protein
LTLLAPEIVDTVLDGRQPAATLEELMQPLAAEWKEQLMTLCFLDKEGG